MIAGEASGDLHAAHVIEALHRKYPAVSVSGAGGTAMRKAGAHIIVDVNELSVMGFTAVLYRAPQVLKVLLRLKRHLAHTRPDLVVLVDFPDFNLHLAGYAKKLGLTVMYYIGPTVWAWRSKRIKKIKRRVDHMAVILPFEKTIYEKHHIPVTYVGHPLLDDAAQNPIIGRARPASDHRVIALLPGSRKDEVERLLPCMLQAASLLHQRDAQTSFIISCAPTIDKASIQEIADAHAIVNYQIVTEPVGAVFARSTLAVVASGTASLEAAIYGIPAIIVYQVSAFNFWLAKKLVKVPHIGMANLIAREQIYPELIQEEVTAENMAATVYALLNDPTACKKMINGIQKVQKCMGTSGASDRVADIAGHLLGDRRAV
jgi:lipid-A-disaccharide synthase